METLEDIKAIIKSLIISTPHGRGMNLRQLELDFYDFNGKELPYKNFGFKNAHDFLESLQDTVYLEQNYEGVIKVHSVYSKNTEHIANMIRAQKVPRKSKSKKYNSYPPSSSNFRYITNTINYNNTLMNVNYTNEARKFVYSTVSNQNNNIRSPPSPLYQQNNSLMNKRYIHAINKVPQHFIVQDNVNKMYNLPQAQVNVNSPPININQYNKPLPKINYQMTNIKTPNSLKNKNHQSYNITLLNMNNQTNNSASKPLNKISSVPPVNYDSNKSPENLPSTNTKICDYVPENKYKIKTDKNIGKNNFENNSWEPDCLFDDEYLSAEESFFDNLSQKFNLLDKNKIEHSNKNDLTISLGNNLNTKNQTEGTIGINCTDTANQLIAQSLNNDFIPVENKNLKTVKQIHETIPINCVDTTNNLLQPSEINDFDKIKSSRKILDNTNKRLNKFNNKFKLYHSNLERISEKNIENSIDIESKNFELAIPDLNYNAELYLIDTNFMEYASSIPNAEIPEDIKIGDKITLFVCEIDNPFRFWFNIATNPIEHPLDKLMADIEEYYLDLPANELRMAKSHIRPGQACAALCQNIWHRGEILDFAFNNDDPNDIITEVKIFYVDYGTVTKCKLENIKYLLYEFSELPKQAYRGTLSDIKPLHIKWDRETTRFFIEHVADKLLYGKIMYLEPDRNIFHLRLLRKYSDEEQRVYKLKEILINNLLIKRGYAKQRVILPKNLENTREQYYYHSQQKFPSFELLEMGKYPTFGQILKTLITENFDIEENTFWMMQLENLKITIRYE